MVDQVSIEFRRLGRRWFDPSGGFVMENAQKKASGVWKKATVLGAASLLAVAGMAMAGQAAQGAGPVQGVQAHIDPATGQLRQPSSSEVKALADAVRKVFATRMAAESTQAIHHADGSVSLALGPESLNVWVVTVGPDGSLHPSCVQGTAAAAAAQSAPALEVK
jgi:hypothetical protein